MILASIPLVNVVWIITIFCCVASIFVIRWNKYSKLRSFEEGVNLGHEEGSRESFVKGFVAGYDMREMILAREAFPDGIPGDK